MIFTVKIAVDDQAESDGEDVQKFLEDIFQEHLPSDLVAVVVDVIEADTNDSF